MSLRHAAAVILAFIAPLAFALEVQIALERLLSFGAPALLLLALRASVTTLGLVAGRTLWRDAADGWRLVRLWAAAAAIAFLATTSTPYFPSNRAPGEKRIAVLLWLAVYALWFAAAHRRVRTVGVEPTKMSPPPSRNHA